jgi:hypothetical protein
MNYEIDLENYILRTRHIWSKLAMLDENSHVDRQRADILRGILRESDTACATAVTPSHAIHGLNKHKTIVTNHQ